MFVYFFKKIIMYVILSRNVDLTAITLIIR